MLHHLTCVVPVAETMLDRKSRSKWMAEGSLCGDRVKVWAPDRHRRDSLDFDDLQVGQTAINNRRIYQSTTLLAE